MATGAPCYIPTTYFILNRHEDCQVVGDVAQRTIRVLFVDDDPVLVRLAALRLTRVGCDVTGCESPEEALERFRARPADFDAVVTDLSMPGMSGMELAQELLALHPDVPILMLSSQFRPEDAAQAQRIGIRWTIVKSEAFEKIPLVLAALPLE
jgi:CheY-like chemotaxis protein